MKAHPNDEKILDSASVSKVLTESNPPAPLPQPSKQDTQSLPQSPSVDTFPETFQEIWALRVFHSPTFAVLIRFEAFLSAKIFKRISRVSVITFEKRATGETKKTYTVGLGDLTHFLSLSDSSVRMNQCELFRTPTEKDTDSVGSRGEMRSQGRLLKWIINGNIDEENGPSVEDQTKAVVVPGSSANPVSMVGQSPVDTWTNALVGLSQFSWQRVYRFKNINTSIHSVLEEKGKSTGTSNESPGAYSGQENFVPAEEAKEFFEGVGVLHQIELTAKNRGWSWAYATDDKGQGTWEILTLEPKTYFPVPSSRTTLKIQRRFFETPATGTAGATGSLDVDFEFFPVRDLLKVRSEPHLTQWNFSAEKDDWRIQGEISSEILDFVGDSFEISTGETLYRSNSLFSTSRLTFYKKGKMMATWECKGSTFLEFVSTEKMKYIQFQN